jgi:WW domain
MTPPVIQETKRPPTNLIDAASGEAAKNDLENPDQKPEVVLPAGWMTVWSKSQKRWYFFDTKANKSVWQWPP